MVSTRSPARRRRPGPRWAIVPAGAPPSGPPAGAGPGDGDQPSEEELRQLARSSRRRRWKTSRQPLLRVVRARRPASLPAARQPCRQARLAIDAMGAARGRPRRAPRYARRHAGGRPRPATAGLRAYRGCRHGRDGPAAAAAGGSGAAGWGPHRRRGDVPRALREAGPRGRTRRGCRRRSGDCRRRWRCNGSG